MVTRVSAALLLSLLLDVAGLQLADAQDRSSDRLIEAGVRARRAGDDAQALVLFTRAWEGGHTPRARAQVGLAERALGKYVEARLHLAEALAATGDAWITERRAALDEELAAVQTKLGRLDVQSEQPGARVHVNGRDAGELPLAAPLWLMPGTVAVEVRAPGFASSARTIVVTEGQLSRERFELVASSPAATTQATAPFADTPAHPPSSALVRVDLARTATRPADTTPAESDGSALPLTGWVTAGVGVAGVGLGVYFYAVREAAASRYNDDARCLVGDLTRESTCGPFAEDARSAETLMAVSLIGGGLLLAGGLALALLGSGSDDGAPPSARVRISCSPVLDLLVGAACEGRF